jgi:hypothetical protein
VKNEITFNVNFFEDRNWFKPITYWIIDKLNGKIIHGGRYHAYLITEHYEEYKKLGGLYYSLLNYLAQNGDSIEKWKLTLKKHAGYGAVIYKGKWGYCDYCRYWNDSCGNLNMCILEDGLKGNLFIPKIKDFDFIPKSWAWDISKPEAEVLEERRSYFKKCLDYCIEKEIDIRQFEKEYEEIMAKRGNPDKRLIGG